MKKLPLLIFIALVALFTWLGVPCTGALILNTKPVIEPPALSEPTFYVNFGLPADATHPAQTLDDTPTWGIAKPGVTPYSGMTWATAEAVVARDNAIAAEAGCNVKIKFYHGEPLVYGKSALIVVGGNMAWASAYGYPAGSISGLHFQGEFFASHGGVHKGFSCAPAIFGLTNVEMIADSIALDGFGGMGGLAEHLSTIGYMGFFPGGGGWVGNESPYLSGPAVYGPLVQTPEPSPLSLLGLASFGMLRRRRAA